MIENLLNVPEFAGAHEEFKTMIREAGEEPDFEMILEKVLPDFDEMPKEGREKIIGAIGNSFQQTISAALEQNGASA